MVKIDLSSVSKLEGLCFILNRNNEMIIQGRSLSTCNAGVYHVSSIVEVAAAAAAVFFGVLFVFKKGSRSTSYNFCAWGGKNEEW